MNPVAYLPQSGRLLNQTREVLRFKHYSPNTGQVYQYRVNLFFTSKRSDALAA